VSRGHGYVQRFVLAELDEQCAVGDDLWLSARALAERLEGAAPARQTCRSVRRALRLLAADGLVEVGSAPVGARARLACRIPPTRAEEAATRRDRRAAERELRRQLHRRPRRGTLTSSSSSSS
jgi:hypothetical protein